MATYFNIEYEPVSGSQQTYGLAANGHSLLMCDVWFFRIHPWWMLCDQDQVSSDPYQPKFGIGVTC